MILLLKLIFSVFAVFFLAAPVMAEDNSGVIVMHANVQPYVHAWLAEKGFEALASDSAVRAELLTNNYLRGGAVLSDIFDNAGIWGNDYPSPTALGWTGSDSAGSSIYEGTYEEDEISVNRSCKHFYNPDLGYAGGYLAGSGAEQAVCGSSRNESALQAAQQLWDAAVRAYSTDKAVAYYQLGRVVHLLGDMGVPDHVFNDGHPGSILNLDDYSNFEEYLKLIYRSYPAAVADPIQMDTLSIPTNYVPAGYDSELAKVFYNMANYTQQFDSSASNGDLDAGAAHMQYPAILALGEGIDPDTAVTITHVHRDSLCQNPVEYALLEGESIDLLRQPGIIALMPSLWQSLRNSCDGLRVQYYHGGVLRTPAEFNVFKEAAFLAVPDRVIYAQAEHIIHEQVRYIAALYELFWSATHVPLPLSAIQLSSAVYSVSEAGRTVTITARRTGSNAGAAGVSYATSNGAGTTGAAAGSDYTARSGRLSWADGDSANKTFTITIINDTLDEANETFAVTLSNPTGVAVLADPRTAVVTITDNDPAPKVQFAAASSTARETTTSASIVVTLSPRSGQRVTVDYATANGAGTTGATAGTDYTATAGTVTFNPGETSRTITIPIINDTNYEGSEKFTVTLTSPVNATLGMRKTHTRTITNDDARQ